MSGWHHGGMDPGLDPAPGRLLIASPTLADPNFARTVVLLIDAGHDGALGVVLNRPTTLEVREVLAGWEPVVANPEVMFSGGPVETDSALAVAEVPDADRGPIGWRQFAGSTGLVDLDAPVEIMASAVSSLRIFAGYAGWSAGQLEDEIAEGAWYVVPAEPGDAFRGQVGGLWADVLRRQGGSLAMMATMPPEPGLN